ncbi:flippase [Cohnella xylanilytica]|uniref:Flippase n=1 Tax=Cohnella xylanilytica TaxID=557555 RepID=A0A841TYA2_9BACL|nr:flippase [Cohnella xylanilytica]MBB6693246.1 flippase [Cohnella xylanilytica]
MKKKYSILLQNVYLLYLIQLTGYALPLITIPYLTRVLGSQNWGHLAIVQAYGAYIILIIEYGFRLSGVRQIAILSNDNRKSSDIFSSIMGAKGLLSIFVILITIVVQLLFPLLKETPSLLWMATIASIIQGLNITWYFQGIERLRFISIVDIISRFFSTILTFVFVRHPNDGIIVLLIQCITSFASLIISFIVVKKLIHIKVPSYKAVTDQLKSGFSLFIMTAAISLYTTSNALILGMFTNPVNVGYYAGAEKIYKAVISLLNPINQVLYPKINKLMYQDTENGGKAAFHGIILISLVGLTMGTVLVIFAPTIINILLGAEFKDAVPILRIFGFLTLIVSVALGIGTQWMLPLGLDRQLNNITIGAGVLNIIVAVVFAKMFQEQGMAWTVIISEFFVVVSSAIYLFKMRLTPWHINNVVEVIRNKASKDFI